MVYTVMVKDIYCLSQESNFRKRGNIIMSALVVYFSFSGNTKIIAEKIAETVNADIIELKTYKKYPEKGFLKFFCGGMSAVFGLKPKLTNDAVDLNGYDTIFIGTPIWAGVYTPPIKSFLSQYNIKGKRIALFACRGGEGDDKCFLKLKAALPGNTFIGEKDFVEPKNNPDECLNNAAKWAADILTK